VVYAPARRDFQFELLDFQDAIFGIPAVVNDCFIMVNTNSRCDLVFQFFDFQDDLFFGLQFLDSHIAPSKFTALTRISGFGTGKRPRARKTFCEE